MRHRRAERLVRRRDLAPERELVDDGRHGPGPFTEHTVALNPKLKGRDIRNAFKGNEYRILLVANKFQTGFDQPLLCAMYVDKRLAGIQAVQTLSRLNRAYPGKTTYVVDFTNEPDDVLAAFRTYYETATLAATTDPDIVHNLRTKLDAEGHYSDEEVERIVTVTLDPTAKQGALDAAIAPVAVRLLAQYKAARDACLLANARSDTEAAETAHSLMNALVLFKADMGAYVRLYTFLSQIFDYGNTALEKRAIFYRLLVPLLDFGREREGIRPVEGSADPPSAPQPGSSADASRRGERGALPVGRSPRGSPTPSWMQWRRTRR